MKIAHYQRAFDPVDQLVVCYGVDPQQARIDLLMDELKYRAAVRKCNTEGHAIEDDSYGNAESGCIALHCTRCGWAHHVTLY